VSRHVAVESLENRTLFAWGAYPQLIQQDDAVATYPNVTGSGVNIALIDSGVDFSQSNLQGKFWTNPGEIAGNGIDDDGDGFKDDTRGWDFYNNDNNPEDQNGHGTAMSGIIAASQFTFNGATYQGIAPAAKIIPLKVSDPTGAYNLTFAQNVEKALKWVEANHAKYNIGIVSMSVRTPLADYNATYADEVSRLAAAGVFLVAAGGQEDPNLDVEYPARDPNVFGVSVVKANNTFPTDTVNRGPGIDLLAPGDGVPILKRGGGVTTSALATSYATPFAAATAALLKQVNPNLTIAQLTSLLKNNGDNVTDTSTGFNFSGRTYKRLNVFNSVKAAVGTSTPANGSVRGMLYDDFDGDGTKDSNEKTGLVAVFYADLDNDAVRDANEPAVTSKRSSGNFTINLAPGTYNIRQEVPLKYRQTAPRKYYTVTVTSNNTVSGLVYADTNMAFASGFVWNDANGNGVKDAGESGLANRRVFIDANNDGVFQSGEQSSISDSTGYIDFKAIPSGTYVIRLVPQNGWTATNTTVYTLRVKAGNIKRGLLFGQDS
jgi:subtilisin family serine protease